MRHVVRNVFLAFTLNQLALQYLGYGATLHSIWFNFQRMERFRELQNRTKDSTGAENDGNKLRYILCPINP